MLYGAKSDMTHLRALGAPCAVVEPLKKLKNMEVRICYFVGYKHGRGGYRVWDPSRKDVVGVTFEQRDATLEIFFATAHPC